MLLLGLPHVNTLSPTQPVCYITQLSSLPLAVGWRARHTQAPFRPQHYISIPPLLLPYPTWVQWVQALTQRPAVHTVALSGTHQDDLDGQGGDDALGVDQVLVACR
jgi:hypothetical protein